MWDEILNSQVDANERFTSHDAFNRVVGLQEIQILISVSYRILIKKPFRNNEWLGSELI